MLLEVHLLNYKVFIVNVIVIVIRDWIGLYFDQLHDLKNVGVIIERMIDFKRFVELVMKVVNDFDLSLKIIVDKVIKLCSKMRNDSNVLKVVLLVYDDWH